MTATNKLISQKFKTTIQAMKKKQETKNSASIIEYISGDHFVKETISIYSKQFIV